MFIFGRFIVTRGRSSASGPRKSGVPGLRLKIIQVVRMFNSHTIRASFYR